MAQKYEKRVVFYMWYYYNGKRNRSAEYNSLKEWFEKCGEWCNAHPNDWQLCKREVTTSVG
jgi:hypothetical protein